MHVQIRTPKSGGLWFDSGRWEVSCSWRAIYFWSVFRGRFWIFFGVPGSMLSCFSASAFLLFLLLCFCFSASLLLCFSCFSAFLLFAFPASLPFCFSVFLASLLLYFCAFLLLLFYFFFSSVMCFCCSTSCSFASLLPVFTASLFFIFFCFIQFCLYPKWNPIWKAKWTLKKP